MLYHLLSPALPRICNILHKHFNILHSSYRCKDVFKQPPFVAYRHSPNLGELLVKAQLPVISNNYFLPDSSRWEQNCGTCLYITIGLTRYTFYATGETRSITSHITCNTKNVIYIVQFAVDKTNAPINVMPAGGGGGGKGWGWDLIVFVGPGLGHLTDLVEVGSKFTTLFIYFFILRIRERKLPCI